MGVRNPQNKNIYQLPKKSKLNNCLIKKGIYRKIKGIYKLKGTLYEELLKNREDNEIMLRAIYDHIVIQYFKKSSFKF